MNMKDDSVYDRWQDTLRRVLKQIVSARDILREQKNEAGRRAAHVELDRALSRLASVANQIEDATDSCYVDSYVERFKKR